MTMMVRMRIYDQNKELGRINPSTLFHISYHHGDDDADADDDDNDYDYDDEDDL